MWKQWKYLRHTHDLLFWMITRDDRLRAIPNSVLWQVRAVETRISSRVHVTGNPLEIMAHYIHSPSSMCVGFVFTSKRPVCLAAPTSAARSTSWVEINLRACEFVRHEWAVWWNHQLSVFICSRITGRSSFNEYVSFRAELTFRSAKSTSDLTFMSLSGIFEISESRLVPINYFFNNKHLTRLEAYCLRTGLITFKMSFLI